MYVTSTVDPPSQRVEFSVGYRPAPARHTPRVQEYYATAMQARSIHFPGKDCITACVSAAGISYRRLRPTFAQVIFIGNVRRLTSRGPIIPPAAKSTWCTLSGSYERMVDYLPNQRSQFEHSGNFKAAVLLSSCIIKSSRRHPVHLQYYKTYHLL
jgi:hypothetical protein